MSISLLNSVSNSYLQSVLGTSFQKTGSNNTTGINLSPLTQADGSELSPFAQLLSILQQLRQSNPAQYQKVTQQIAANLQSASQTAQAQGNTSAAAQLNQLATDFSNASKSGQLPNLSHLAQANGAHHHHRHHAHSASSGPNSAQTDSLDPMNIIESTLSNISYFPSQNWYF